MMGTRVEVEITGIAHGGIVVARHEGRVIFVSDAIPGERVLVEVTDDAKSSFWRADTVAVLTPSPHRRDHIWPAASLDRPPADRAGGAEFGHIDLAHQRTLKAEVLKDSMKRMGRVDVDPVVEALPSGDSDFDSGVVDSDGTGWRTRTRLQVAADGRPGPFAARSHRVIEVDDLPLSVREARLVAPLDERFPGAAFVDLVVPSVGNPFVLQGEAPQAAEAPASRSRGRAKRGQAKPVRRQYPAKRITELVGDREFSVDVRGFWQVHRHAARTLTGAVQDALDLDRFDERAANLDLYGGVGLLAAAVGDRVGAGLRITTVESDAAATDHAAENLSEWVGASAVTARVDRFLRELVSTAGPAERARLAAATVVLDPPRSGAGSAVVDGLAALSPAQIVYVACDPVALARDVALFGSHGYRLSGLRGFDLFPNTHHVEAVATLVRG